MRILPPSTREDGADARRFFVVDVQSSAAGIEVIAQHWRVVGRGDRDGAEAYPSLLL
jgi:hypothetical protein